MNDLIPKPLSPLAVIGRGVIRGALWAPRKIVKAVKAVKEAASNLIERVRLAMQRRPSRAVRAQEPLPLLSTPTQLIPRSHPELERLWQLRKAVEMSTDLQATHDSFLNEFGHHFSHREVNSLTNAIQFPELYRRNLDTLIMGMEQEQRYDRVAV